MPGDSGTALPNKAICCERGLHAPGAAGGLRRQWDVREGHGGDVGSGYRGDTLAAHIGVPVPMVPLRCPRMAYWHWVRGPGLPRGGASLFLGPGVPKCGVALSSCLGVFEQVDPIGKLPMLPRCLHLTSLAQLNEQHSWQRGGSTSASMGTCFWGGAA